MSSRETPIHHNHMGSRSFMFRVGGVLFLLLALVGIFYFAKSYSKAIGTVNISAVGRYGNGITCGEELVAVHYHAHIQFVYNGNELDMPNNVGIDQTNQCLYWLHVHPNDNGVVHIEAPADNANRVFYIGDLMAVWRQTASIQPPAGTTIELNATSFFGLPVDATHPMTIYVNGKKFTGDPQTVPLTLHASIWIEYGTQIVQPTPFTFKGNE